MIMIIVINDIDNHYQLRSIMRNSKQKDIVLSSLRKIGTHPSADELYKFIHEEHAEIGVATVYRNLNKLSENGEIRKINGLDGSSHYDWNLEPHYHFICKCCGKIHDITYAIAPDMIARAECVSGCKILELEITFKGLCKECENHLKTA